MNTLKFKTDIKCTGCLEKVTPHLNEATGVEKWEVDLENPDKVLTVETGGTSGDVIATVQKAGFRAEQLTG